MAKRTVKQDRNNRDRHLPRLPHPSWRWAGAVKEDQVALNADDFWSKLGI